MWLFLPAMERMLYHCAGVAAVSPFLVKVSLHRVIIVSMFIHVGLVAAFSCWVCFRSRRLWTAVVSCVIALAVSSFAAHKTQEDKWRMDSYCRGIAASIFGRIKEDVLLRELKLQLERPVDQMRGVAKPPAVIEGVFKGRKPRMLLLPLDAESPSAVQVLWHSVGAAFGIHYGGTPVSPDRFLDHDVQLTNGLWIVIRQQ